MEVILLERIERLGQMGDVVVVKDGFARNFLLPKNKALRANKENLEFFEKETGYEIWIIPIVIIIGIIIALKKRHSRP